jgi:hypothetical protein
MTPRYSIYVRECCSDHKVELLRVDTSPQAIVNALREKSLKGGQKFKKYISVRIVDHDAK